MHMEEIKNIDMLLILGFKYRYTNPKHCCADFRFQVQI